MILITASAIAKKDIGVKNVKAYVRLIAMEKIARKFAGAKMQESATTFLVNAIVRLVSLVHCESCILSYESNC